MSSNPAHGEVYSIQHYMIKFLSDLPQVSGFLRVLRFPPPLKLTIITLTLTLYELNLLVPLFQPNISLKHFFQCPMQFKMYITALIYILFKNILSITMIKPNTDKSVLRGHL